MSAMPGGRARRRFWRAAALALLAAAGGGAAQAPAAKVPMVKSQAPGFYRMMLGDYEITALNDGVVDFPPAKLLTNTTAGEVAAMLRKRFEPDAVPTSVNAFLINTGDRLVLVDTGAGKVLGPRLGGLAESLRAAGYRPDQVDAVLITHMHPDHIGGLVKDGQPAFPNATVYADKTDAALWLDPAEAAKAPEDQGKLGKYRFRAVKESMDAYSRRGRLRYFDGTGEVLPGIRAIASRGHSPGHAFFEVESKGERLLFWGDIMHFGQVQLELPEVAMYSDIDPAKATASRLAALKDAADGRYLVAAAHLPFPGLGHIRKAERGYAWVPVTYEIPPR
ncbi:MBL fold metallo-hydrolase [Sphingobium sp. SA916]|uniref:MBL fold metallo-hydrolase n=1 Tax=Sphingobium sp. SA916 TaxID=1851207 RepID=UPI000CBF3003|nr:MBL fold metallo-hydrolase [Sphingobium sp. SA916]PNP99435.1 MBL fold metallo-hydrolase [Sphingobium sp. SA916]